MRKRKHHPATEAQQPVLRDLYVAGATSEATAVKAPVLAPANTLNRLFCRGWLAKAAGGRWWVTEAGLAELERHVDALPNWPAEDPRPVQADG